ncbi:RNB domain-containing ribonuclease [Propionivibrio sp.]|uniref:ribonuclease catalytic domain-containing protein n=1 Tax=Propionivibrio sp. TaxID=2212460 RepID=UPI00260C7FFC|nr:RNB domain-containing ribonuclease [Propionivibrio sp.]
MHVLYEEDGAFKTATILADNETSLQVETASGKRAKIKTANVLLRYLEPPPSELLGRADSLAEGIEAEFLWECAGDGEFSFSDFADEYFGGSGHRATPVEASALLLALHSAPVHFHRKGKGRFRKAPPDILAAALAGLEKKRQQALAIERMVGELKKFRLPPEFAPLLSQLLYKPDRNRFETRALEAASADTGLSVPHLLEKCGAIPSAHNYHFQRFLLEHFPRGIVFPDTAIPLPPTALPRANVQAFSIDDAATTEIDDAFSLQPLPGVGWRVGIHIAAPGLGFAPDSPLGEMARERLSTVYMPGNKITMLPATFVERFTLAAGRECPAVSLYLTVTPEFEIVAHETQIDCVPIVANLRHHDIEPLFNEQTLAAGLPEFAFNAELKTLWQLANACEGRRGKPSAMQGNNDYNFSIDGDPADAESCRVDISERKRGSPLDKLVAELMIVANSTWGGLLAEKGVPAIYRVQHGGKVRMTTSPQPHDGLGVAQYAWSSSPLRRYVDLLNQWQLIACLNGAPPYFHAKSDALFAALRDFELTYNAYAEFQRGMERYWCLRWLRQEGVQRIEGVVRRENLVKLDHLPLIQRVNSVPELKSGQRLRLSIESVDYLTLELGCRYVETLDRIEKLAEAPDETLEVVV